MKKIISKFIWSFLLVGACSAAEPPSLYFTFDSGLAPLNKGDRVIIDGRAADRTPQSMVIPGIGSSALQIGRSKNKKGIQSFTYVAKTPVCKNTGSISFWVKPVDWKGNDREFHNLISAKNGNFRLIIYKFFSQQKLTFIYGELGKGGSSAPSATVSIPINKWQPGQWHHVCAVWDTESIAFYVDGVKGGSAPVKTIGKNGFSRFFLGEYWKGNPGATALEELRIFNRRLTPAEVQAEYNRKASQITDSDAPVAFTVPKKKIQTDGKIAQWEYPVAVSGMYDVKRRAYALKQSSCFFSWDSENLYIAMKTPGGKIAAKHTARDSAVWDDDSIEVWFHGFNGKHDVYQFIVNANGAVYDALNRNKKWNAVGLRSKSTVNEKEWQFEIAIPWKNFNFVPGAGKSVRFNLCRSFAPAGFGWTGLSHGAYGAATQFTKMILAEKSPEFEIAPLGNLSGGLLNTEVKIRSQQADDAEIFFNTSGPRPWNFNKKLKLEAGKELKLPVSSAIRRNQNLNILIKSRKSGTLYHSSIKYVDAAPTVLSYIYTDIPEQKLNMWFDNQIMFANGNLLNVKMLGKNGKAVWQKSLKLDDRKKQVKASFDISDLKYGVYKLEYSIIDPVNKNVLLTDKEEYGKYPAPAAWDSQKDGLEHTVPSPWTPISAANDRFSCWGRQYRLGGNGMIGSVISQNMEMLQGPVTFLLDNKAVKFNSKIVAVYADYVDYELNSTNSDIPLKINLRAEFDGLLRWTLEAMPGRKSNVIKSLELQIPLKRELVTYFDDNTSIVKKVVFKKEQNETLDNDLTVNPYFWCGGDHIGLMGGTHSQRGWYVRDKKKGMQIEVAPSKFLLRVKFVDTPVKLTRNGRKMAFYLQPTPVKKRSIKGAQFRYGNTWTGHPTQFFEYKRPGFYNEKQMEKFVNRQEKLKQYVFWYNATTGVSPYIPEWNYFGKMWRTGRNKLGQYMQDSPLLTRAARNHGTYTFGCLKCDSFKNFRIDVLARFIQEPKYKVKNLYFDLAWPHLCDNEVHGCSWKDEFGYVHRDNDVWGVREVMLRTCRILQKQNPDGLIMGHLIATRTPSDVFYDILLMGEAYDRHVLKSISYYDVFTPDMMRASYASRAGEMTIRLIPQLQRSLVLYAPERLKIYNAQGPAVVHAIRHYLGYLLLHNMNSTIYPLGKYMRQVFKAQDWLGWNEKMVFHPYWSQKNNPVRSAQQIDRLLVSSYTNGTKCLAVIVNDTTKTVNAEMLLDESFCGKNGKAVNCFDNRSFDYQNGSLKLNLKPREALILQFIK